jgi:hypothetical protein
VRRSDWAWALSIAGLALALRVLGIRFGLPYYHHWDEGWITDSAANMLQKPWWEPRIYHYGAPLPWAIALTTRALGFLFPHRLFDPNDGALLHLIGRWITAILSSSGAIATYLAARHATLGDRGAQIRAIYAGIAYATAAELVSHGRYAVTDANIAALVAWTLAFGALYARGGRLLWAACTMITASVAVAFKITAAPILVIPLGLVLVRRLALPKRARIVALALALPLGAVVFFALNPNVLLHWMKAMGDISVRMNQYSRGGVPEFLVRHRGLDHLGAILYAIFFQIFHRWPLASAALAALSFGGLGRALRARSLVCLAGAAHSLILVLGLAVTSRAFLLRNYLVVVPILCVGLGFAMEALHARFRGIAPAVALAAAFGAFFVAVPCAQAARTEMLTTDARLRALDWIDASHGSRRATIAFTPEVAVDATADRGDIRTILQRRSLDNMPDVADEARVQAYKPDFVMIVSHPDFSGRGDIWPFRSVPGYREVARFDSNPYEHNYDISPTWMGRFNVIVLHRE